MNNNKPSSSKSTISILVIVALAGLGYFWWSGNSTPASSSITSSDSQAAVGVQVLNLLNQIQSLSIDTSLFTDPAYKTLVDYSVMIPPVPVGRSNPFAPIPGFSTVSTTP